MVSLAISATLLIALAAAFSASSSAITVNDEFFRASQAARITTGQVVNEIRDAASVQSYADHVVIVRPPQTLTPNEISRTFSYNAASSQVTLQIAYSGGTYSPMYAVASNVTAASFGPGDQGYDSLNNLVVLRVPISLTVAIGQTQVTLNGCAAVRRAQKY